MKKILSILLLATILPAQASAQDAVCGALDKHVPNANVMHQADDDVNLTKADVVPDVIKVPLTNNLAQRVAALNGTGTQLEAPLGMVEIHKDGHVTYNGEDWTSSVMTLCGESHAIITTTEVFEGNDILNQKKILNEKPIINRPRAPVEEAPAEAVKIEVSKKMEDSPLQEKPVRAAISKREETVQPPKRAIENVNDDNEFMVKPAGYVSKELGDMILVDPKFAVEPVDMPEPVVRPRREQDRVILSDIIEGGEYKEIYYNE